MHGSGHIVRGYERTLKPPLYSVHLHTWSKTYTEERGATPKQLQKISSGYPYINKPENLQPEQQPASLKAQGNDISPLHTAEGPGERRAEEKWKKVKAHAMRCLTKTESEKQVGY